MGKYIFYIFDKYIANEIEHYPIGDFKFGKWKT
jgi:hypothetical protein